MTSKDIIETPAYEKTEREWMRELAYQLALLNEKQALPTFEPKRQPQKVKPQ